MSIIKNFKDFSLLESKENKLYFSFGKIIPKLSGSIMENDGYVYPVLVLSESYLEPEYKDINGYIEDMVENTDEGYDQEEDFYREVYKKDFMEEFTHNFIMISDYDHINDFMGSYYEYDPIIAGLPQFSLDTEEGENSIPDGLERMADYEDLNGNETKSGILLINLVTGNIIRAGEFNLNSTFENYTTEMETNLKKAFPLITNHLSKNEAVLNCQYIPEFVEWTVQNYPEYPKLLKLAKAGLL